MGNLLGTPITDKETHVGITIDEMPSSSSPDGGGLQYGISSMQGWRVHMEDAHIAQPFLYAERPVSAASVGGGDDESEVDDNGKVRRNYAMGVIGRHWRSFVICFDFVSSRRRGWSEELLANSHSNNSPCIFCFSSSFIISGLEGIASWSIPPFVDECSPMVMRRIV